MNTGDTALVLISAAFVFLMTPALGFFYGGLGRRKNVVSNLMNSFFILGLATVLWVAVGFSLAFGPDHGGVIGDFSWVSALSRAPTERPSRSSPTPCSR